MNDSGRDGADDLNALETLGTVVRQRSGAQVWRGFVVAQHAIHRRREMTTQRLFLTGRR